MTDEEGSAHIKVSLVGYEPDASGNVVFICRDNCFPPDKEDQEHHEYIREHRFEWVENGETIASCFTVLFLEGRALNAREDIVDLADSMNQEVYEAATVCRDIDDIEDEWFEGYAWLVVTDVFVQEKHRGQGIGQALLRRAFDFHNQCQIKFVVAHTEPENDPVEAPGGRVERRAWINKWFLENGWSVLPDTVGTGFTDPDFRNGWVWRASLGEEAEEAEETAPEPEPELEIKQVVLNVLREEQERLLSTEEIQNRANDRSGVPGALQELKEEYCSKVEETKAGWRYCFGNAREERRVSELVLLDEDGHGYQIDETSCGKLVDEDKQEEAVLDVLLTNFQNRRIEVNLVEPNCYEDHESARIPFSVLLTVSEAEKFVEALQKAIAHAKDGTVPHYGWEEETEEAAAIGNVFGGEA